MLRFDVKSISKAGICVCNRCHTTTKMSKKMSQIFPHSDFVNACSQVSNRYMYVQMLHKNNGWWPMTQGEWCYRGGGGLRLQCSLKAFSHLSHSQQRPFRRIVENPFFQLKMMMVGTASTRIARIQIDYLQCKYNFLVLKYSMQQVKQCNQHEF